MSIRFENEWVENAIKKALGVKEGEITETDLDRVKYIRIGDVNRNGQLQVEVSKEEPPRPFVDTDGGDEWACCICGDDIRRFLEEKKDNLTQPFMFGFDYDEPDYDPDASEQAWEKYKESITAEVFSDESRYDEMLETLYKDLALFKKLEVLRMIYLHIPDYSFFEEMKDLRALELVSVEFDSTDGSESLLGLEQLAAWLD